MALDKRDIRGLRGDLSPFLIHLTRNGNFKEWSDVTGQPNHNYVTVTAKQSLLDIISGRSIRAKSPFGYFNYKVPFNGRNPASRVNRSWLFSVCFTETPVDHIYVQCEAIKGRKLPFQPYGLAFFEESVRRSNGNPVMYFDSNNAGIKAALDSLISLPNCNLYSDSMILYEGFGPPIYYVPGVTEIDFRWEREWRIKGNFNFDIDRDVAFGICPSNEISSFETLTSNRIPFIDPTKPIGLIKKKLRRFPRLSGLI